jgi:hypothetical protein
LKEGAVFFPLSSEKIEEAGSGGDSLNRETNGFWSFFNKLREKKPIS